MDNASFLRRRKKLLISAALALVALFLVLNYAIVVTSLVATPTGEEATIKITSGEKGKEFKLQPGQRKISIVKKSSNQIKASSENSYTGAGFGLGLIGYKSFKISVDPQKRSETIGLSDGSCPVDNTSANYITFYRCSTNGNYVNATRNGINYFSNISRGGESTSILIKPYLNGYLSFTQTDSKLVIEGFEVGENSYRSTDIASIDFEGSLGQGTVATDNSSSKSSKIAVFDTKNNRLTVLSGLNDKSPLTLLLQEKLKKYHSNKSLVNMSGNMLVLFNGSEVFQGEGELLTKSDSEQHLYYIDANTMELSKEQSVDRELKISYIANNANGDVIFYAYSEALSKKGLYLANSGGIEKVSVQGRVGGTVCWKDNNSFLFTSNDNEILAYSTSDKFYRLIYASTDKPIFGMSCYDGSAYLSHSPKYVSVADPRLEFIKIPDENLSGKRLETLLPLGPDVIIDIDSAFSFKKNVYVNLINTDILDFTVDPNKAPKQMPQNPKKLQNNAIDFFKKQGIDTSQYNFIFTY